MPRIVLRARGRDNRARTPIQRVRARCHICGPENVNRVTAIPPTTEIPTVQPAPPTSKTGGEMLWEVVELLGGFATMLLPLLVLAVPGLLLFLVLPAALVLVLVAIPATLAAAVVGLPYLLVRAVRR
jgi:hypothetical protein